MSDHESEENAPIKSPAAPASPEEEEEEEEEKQEELQPPKSPDEELSKELDEEEAKESENEEPKTSIKSPEAEPTKELDDEEQVKDSDEEAPKKSREKVIEDDDEDSDEEEPKKPKEKLIDDDVEEGEEEEEAGEEGEESDDDKREVPPAPVYDFDIMMAKRKEENSKKRRRRNYDIINDNDDIIADIINQMRDAVEVDNEANRNKQAATRKLKLLPFLISQLRKVDLRDAFLDSDVLRVISDWLAPLPDRSLPHLHIREGLINILIDFNLYDLDKIKSSGIGKAIMYLYKHPKETKENKQKAKHLISCWSRPIFQLDTSFDSISREEREQRDLELLSKKRRVSQQQPKEADGDAPGTSSSGMRTAKDETAQKPGDKGWIPRARVPAPSMKDYVIRPRSTVDGEVEKSSKKSYNMLEKYMRNQQERRRASRQQRAVNMRIDRV